MTADRSEHTPPAAAFLMVERQLRRQGIRDERVLDAMTRAPRHLFVPGVEESEAYADRALPTAEGQTISQPYMVARMTEVLDVQPGMRVLEVGTGSGYQTAVLLELGAAVVSVERFASLAQAARQRLHGLYPDAALAIHVGDGTRGWPAAVPYDRILVTAGAPDLPPPLWEQLRDGGRVVIPTGDRQQQTLMVIVKENGQRRDYRDVGCRFVPLVGEAGWQES